MNYVTKGIDFYTSYEMPLDYSTADSFCDVAGELPLFRIIYMEQGEGAFIIGGKKILCTAPAYFCLNSGERLEVLDESGVSIRSLIFQPCVINVHLTPDAVNSLNAEGSDLTTYQDMFLLRPFIRRERPGAICLKPRVINALRIQELFETLADELVNQGSRELWPCRSRSYFIEMLFVLERTAARGDYQEDTIVDDSSPAWKVDVDSVVLYLKTRFSERITLDEIASQFATNRTTLSDCFKAQTGQTIFGYLTNVRIDAAAMILRNTELTVSEVMSRTGFSDLSYFGKTFKKITGYSPMDYRKMFDGVPY